VSQLLDVIGYVLRLVTEFKAR